MRKSPKFSPEVIGRAVRMVFEAKDRYPSQWAAIGSSGETCRWIGVFFRQIGWVRDTGVRSANTDQQ